MTWNYRVLRRADVMGNTYLTIGEVYYKPNGDIDRWSSENCIVADESEGSVALKAQLRRMLNDVRLHPDPIDVVEVEAKRGKTGSGWCWWRWLYGGSACKST